MTRQQKTAAVAAALALLLLILAGGYLAWTRRPAAAPGRAQDAVAPAPARPAGAPPAPAKLLAEKGARVEHDAALANGSFAGVVLNFSTGKPVAGAQVTFARADQGAAGVSVTADDAGRFEIGPPAPGGYSLAVATAAGYLPFAPEWGASPIVLVARPGLRVADLTVYLRPALDYQGVVLDPDGRPVAAATVTLLGAGGGEQALSPLPDRYTSDAAGAFVFHAPDGAVLEARAPGFRPGRADLDERAQVSHRLEIHLGRPAADDAALGHARLAGRVVDAAGGPLAGALLRAEHTDGEGPHPSAEARSGDDGRFTLDGLDPGAHQVSAQAAGHASATVKAETGAEVTLVLPAGGLLVGRVVDEGGAPAPVFSVLVSRPHGISETVVNEATVIDAEGHFAIDVLAPGDYRVRASAPGHAASPPAAARATAAGEDPAELVLQLRRGGALRGQVVDRETGSPLVFARVSAGDTIGEGPSAVPLQASTVTDERGEFTLQGIAPGPRSVLAAAAAHHMKMISVEVVDGDTVGPVRLDLLRTREGEAPTMELVGIGAKLHASDDALVVDGLVPGGGAQAAGLAQGDAIVRIDGAPVTEIGFQDAIQRIRGPEGTRLRLAIRRGGDIGDVVVERRRIAF